MSTSTTRRPPAPAEGPALRTTPPLPRWTTAAVVAGSLVLSALVMGALLGFGPVAIAVVALLLVLVVLPTLSRLREGPRRARDRFITVLVTTAFLLAVLPLVSVLWTVTEEGLARFDWAFFTEDMRGVIGAGGGGLHAIAGTLLITAATAAISVPIGVMCAIYLVEYGTGKLAKAITFLVDVMTGIPSIVAGLFAVALFTTLMGPGTRLGVGGAVALSVLMIPIVVRSTEEMLKLVSTELREASYALGVPKWRTIVKVVLPTAAAGIATGITLAIARVIGETAPLLIVVGSTAALNWNLFEGRVMTLPVFTYFQYTQPGIPPEAAIARAWTAALVLLIIVMVLNLLARLISRKLAPKTGR